MAVAIPSGYGQASIKILCTGVADLMVTTFGFKAPAPAGDVGLPDANAGAIVGYLASADGLLNASNFSSQYRFVGVDVVQNNGAGHAIGTAPANIAGISGMNTPPPNCAVLVKKSTATGGRHGRGRFFLPPMNVSEGDISGAGVLTGPVVAEIQMRVNDLKTKLTTAGLDMVVLHAEGGPAPYLVTSLTVASLLATQRRRMR